ncbi:ExbD/TolR family protein [Leptospira bandrabouensis]|uniref:Biopolymer transporter ExbD n=1 Tax=Leptospira bandrabouensis TaxID=2484903 RepID=A0A6H3NL79_9LEPT|nr:biopolymer transporter ExbD [Leptospira bandrabouensis]MCG6145503.1 biopolymer transporter ExbD [Leptospira bandrabouensis]MCG6152534.1 biopolymer transporter ExbD [Leptospira bandrabouensis]MCG6161127.1 biopolymer transporter ExbD [Leptospira bandrabouensis]MCG6164749.1 biopolymer transporter ExbD [Leptospira bandrabouensis]MCW7459134.1 biopolymer transporter ExbD [Leptospira bandrabouensis]
MKFRKTQKSFNNIELAPLIDVISFIVIYFLMNATLEKNTALKVELPRSSSVAKEKQKDELVITVDKQGKIYLDQNSEAVPLEGLTEKINGFLGPEKERDPKKNKVIIRGDGGASYQVVVKVIDAVNAAGVSRFNLAMVKGTSK